MVFNAVLFIAVLFITGLFLYLSYTFKRDADRKVTYEGRYLIEMSSDFRGENLSIYVNDSLLMNATMPDTLVALEVERFAEESALIVVNNATDIMTPFNLAPKGSKVLVKKQTRGLSRVEAGNPGFPRLVQVTSGGFSRWL